MTDEEREDLTEAIAEHIFFLDEELQKKVAELLGTVDSGLGAEIMKEQTLLMITGHMYYYIRIWRSI